MGGTLRSGRFLLHCGAKTLVIPPLVMGSWLALNPYKWIARVCHHKTRHPSMFNTRHRRAPETEIPSSSTITCLSLLSTGCTLTQVPRFLLSYEGPRRSYR